ncbi:hypothetical protein [Sinomicrobium weinanense]|uniref:Lipoprotein n=1 Tax=Sinomicrobium weinanense TaxID=2842200 RepID=A0A926Q3Q0_9FLAO|nr:hypothetical protein [Sinomicrobium weinanense]MBC9797812.1 hypothetical protein [Sinomicrobium weinanense]MBU3125961.1 hypothetical protein [Sinomicrobium weinanense]
MKNSGKFKKLLLLFITLASCKSNFVEVKNPEKINLKQQCPLISLKKTVNYTNEVDALSNEYKNEVIEIESTEVDSLKYDVILDLKESSQYLWLLKSDLERNTDSILIHCIDSTKGVESEFDIDNCQIEIMETEFYTTGEPKVSKSKTIQF